MTLITLIDTLEEEFKKLFEYKKYETKGDKHKRPRVLSGWYTKKDIKGPISSDEDDERIDPDEEFPYILISPVDLNSDGDQAVVKVLIIFAAYSEEDDGWKDTALMAEQVRQYFKSQQYIGEDHFEIERDLKIEFPDAQPYPQWFAFMDMSFKVYEPVNIGGVYDEE